MKIVIRAIVAEEMEKLIQADPMRFMGFMGEKGLQGPTASVNVSAM